MRISLAKQVGILLLVPTGVALVSLGVLYDRFSKIAGESPLIAMAGQQRLLSHQLGDYRR